MPDVLPFDFDGNAVRVVLREEEPWFVAKDVCGVLALENSREAVKRLDPDELVSVKLTSGFQTRKMNAVSESGLYALIFTSRKPEAKRFRKWVTGEVLPSIRKTGRFALGGEGLAALPPNIKPGLKATAMNTAVQVAKMTGGDEAEVDRLFAKYCGLLAPAVRPEEIGEKSLYERWAEECVEPVSVHDDYDIRKVPKVGGGRLYEHFRNWCIKNKVLRRDIPTMTAWGLWMKRHFEFHKSNVVRYLVRLVQPSPREKTLNCHSARF